MMKGIFITFEGIDGCGKSTQCELLKNYLESNGKDFLFVREPGGTEIGERIREILLDKKNSRMTARTELLLFEAARAQITDEVIKPALEEGKIVLCDRFFDSSSAYQGMARGMGMDFVGSLNMAATGGLKPDITFFFDITAEAAFERRGKRGEASDRIELAGLKFQEDVRKGYLELAKNSDGRIVTIDAAKGIDEIFAQILETLEGKI
ncbi:MAG: dTMP kinase [Clostridiales bacterium]|nr:dTMP kinase [Clostridiales bacterium]MBR4914996.1 dTMP kinase [Clostridiales bacterium]MBR4947948.1 dTMP kinase [Clostridiales bacterium]